MATAAQRATAILEALSDGNVPAPQVKDTIEEFLDVVGQGAGNETLASAFLSVLSRHLDSRVRRNAARRKANELKPQIAAAEAAARDKLPDLPDRARAGQTINRGPSRGPK